MHALPVHLALTIGRVINTGTPVVTLYTKAECTLCDKVRLKQLRLCYVCKDPSVSSYLNH